MPRARWEHWSCRGCTFEELESEIASREQDGWELVCVVRHDYTYAAWMKRLASY